MSTSSGRTIELLPSELRIHIVRFLDPQSLVRLEQTSRQWSALLHEHDAQCWAQHAVEGGKVDDSLVDAVQIRQDRCLDASYWNACTTWKEMTRRCRVLERNWLANEPDVCVNVIGHCEAREGSAEAGPPVIHSKFTGQPLDIIQAGQDSSPVWRVRLDTAHDAEFVMTTFITGGIRVVDARIDGHGEELWQLSSDRVRSYAHLEYRNGVACWDSASGIEVWKRWKWVHGTEPADKRGHFVHVGTVPDILGMRGFMLNESLHLGISTQVGRTCIYDVNEAQPKLLHEFDINSHATGHIEHDETHSIYAMGKNGYSFYEKATGEHVGDLNFRRGALESAFEECSSTNVFFIDSDVRLPTLAGGENPNGRFCAVQVRPTSSDETRTYDNRRSSSNEDIVSLEQILVRRGERQTEKPILANDEWGFASIKKLQDGATMFVGRSKGGRFLFCTDLFGVLECIAEGTHEQLEAKIRECLSIVECGKTRCMSEFQAGGWLTVHGNRAAWEIEDKVYICELPRRRNTLVNEKTKVIMLNGSYAGEIPMPKLQVPASAIYMHDDCLIMTYFHPAYAHARGDDRQADRWTPSMLKSVRVIHFAHKGLLQDKQMTRKKRRRSSTERQNLATSPAEAVLRRRWLITSQMMGNGVAILDGEEIQLEQQYLAEGEGDDDGLTIDLEDLLRWTDDVEQDEESEDFDDDESEQDDETDGMIAGDGETSQQSSGDPREDEIV